MNNILVSIILPSLNIVDYIDECMRSVINQSLKEIDIVCVDAGSTDGTWEKLVDYKKKDSRIRLIKSDIRSYGYQVNLGINVALGEYIGIVETDDYIDRDMYRTLYSVALSNGCDYVKANYKSYWTASGNHKVIELSDTIKNTDLCYNEVINVAQNDSLIQVDTNVWSGIYRREFLMDNNIWFNESPGAAFQDIGFLQLVHWKANTAIYLKEAFYNYCIDRENSSSNVGRGLQFIYQEYSRLFDMLDSVSIVDYQLNSLYKRMYDVFMENTGKINSINDSEDLRIIVEWFLEKLNNFGISIDKKCVITHIERKMEEKDRNLNIVECAKGEDVIIFGCGNWGKKCYRLLDNTKCNLLGFADNNEELWGDIIGGITVNNPMYYINCYPNALWVIANKNHSTKIKEQLINCGIYEKRIMLLSS